MSVASPDPAPTRLLSMACLALLGFGALVRIWAFGLRGALWTDEAGLGLNVVGREFLQVARPFVHQQYAPYLYVLTDKLLTLALGPSDAVLRLPSLIAGLLLLPVLALLAKRADGLRAALFALVLLVPNGLAVYFSTEFKPYEQDALVSSLLLLFAWPALTSASDQQRNRALITVGLFGSAAPWLSLPSIFTLSAVGTALVVDAWNRKLAGARLVWLAAIGGLWLFSFALHYVLFLKVAPQTASELEAYWATMDAFGPFPPHSLGDLRWYLAKFFYLFNLFAASGGFGMRYLAAALWCLGLIELWRRQRAVGIMLTLPIPLLMAASATHKYIIADRTVLYMAPLIIVPTAVGLAALSRFRAASAPLAAAALTALLCLGALRALGTTLTTPPPTHDIRHTVAHLSRHFLPGDRLYVDTQVAWTYEFYAQQAAFAAPWAEGNAALADPAPALRVLDALKGSRVWAIVPTVGDHGPASASAIPAIRKAENVVTHHLQQSGRQLEQVDGGNVRLYLYDLSKATVSAQR